MKYSSGFSLLLQRVLLYLALLTVACLDVAAQDFSVIASWMNPNATDSRGDRETLANAAAEALVQKIGSNGSLDDNTNSQALASMYSVLARQDIYSGNKSWMGTVTTNLRTWTSQTDIFANGTTGSLRTTTNAAQWGLAFYYAYEAYGDTSFLSLAKATFDQIYPYFITSEDASSYRAPANRTFKYNATNGKCFSLAAGGIWWLPDVRNNDEVHADTVGPFAVLSGHLYQTTSNETYKTAGMLSTGFLGWSPFMWNDTNLYIHGKVLIDQCEWYADPSPGPHGWYIQALAMWGNITSDPSLTTRLRQLVSTSTQNPLWTQPNGVLIDPAPSRNNESDNLWDDKAILIRGLSETLRRFPTWTDVAPFIKGFLNVQYNELTGYARSPGTDAYSTALFGPGPPPSTFSSSGNILALDVLNAAFDALPRDNDTSMPSSRTASRIGAIAGGITGGVVCIAVLLGTLFVYLRRRRRSHDTHDGVDENATDIQQSSRPVSVVASVEPYTLVAPTSSRTKRATSPEYLDTPSLSRAAESTSGPAAESSVGELQDEDVLTVSAFRRLLTGLVQEHTQESAPPEYSSRFG
ncbi:hypothetical protein PENSPDRAFT_659255 [Peniophora sp. CONT]|nr:hypothetical protein PENSPDRAFT_659255 [Peniophora sp. CONT]